jgi:S-adenosylmethionine synthetase
VASGLASECEVQLAYAIGVAKPVSVLVKTFGTGKLPEEKIEEIILKEFDLRPSAIIETLGLKAPVFKKTASYGHFGDSEFSWEKTDKVKTLKKYLD